MFARYKILVDLNKIQKLYCFKENDTHVSIHYRLSITEFETSEFSHPIFNSLNEREIFESFEEAQKELIKRVQTKMKKFLEVTKSLKEDDCTIIGVDRF